MGRIQLFHATLDGARELEETPFRNEKELQNLLERHLRDLTGIDFLDSEHSTGSRHKRRADTLGLDGQQRPVVVEYKLGQGGAAISQGLDYLYWLEDHKGDFREVVREKLGNERSRNIDFKNSWLLCVAGEFRREDEITAETNTRRIDLLSFRRHGASTVLLEWVCGGEAVPKQVPSPPDPQPPRPPDFSVYHQWDRVVSNKILHTLFQGLCDYVETLSEEVWVKPSKTGFSAKLKRAGRSNLLYIWPNVRETMLTVQLRLDPKSVPLEEGFTRDISHIGSHGPYGLQIFIRNQNDLARAKPLLKRSYDEAG